MSSKSLHFVQKHKTQMQTPTRMDKVVIEDYYHMTTVNENLDWMKSTHMLSIFLYAVGPPFVTPTFASTFLIAFLTVHTREN